MSENNLMGYEKRYNAVYNYLDTHKALKNILLLLYFVYGLGESRHFLINDININEVNGASISLAVINTLDVST